MLASTRLLLNLLLILPVATGTAILHADTLTVAVASNFAETLEVIVSEFERQEPHRVTLVRGSSGRHYAQIINGAPFDLFFSADSARPDRLVSEQRVPADAVSVYAIGQLVLWAPELSSAADIKLGLQQQAFNRLSIANPRLAPYGRAALEVLENLGLDSLIQNSRVVMGENIAQAFQFVATGNADMGFVALSQVISGEKNRYWPVPQTLYQPIAQQLAVIRPSPATQVFLDYLSGPRAREIILQRGYKLPATH
ncbi:MAG: molybdate ABC transporter substrate-binding protein [Gammaproteobacteria bacterium]|nr:molybdate ABC transporter substrate-binding protein [Gammaproteobacteria bacterium]